MSVKVIGGWYPTQLTQEIIHADATEHSLSCADIGVPEHTSVLSIYIESHSVGVGDFEIKTSSGGTAQPLNDLETGLWFKSEDGLFYYELETANDDINVGITGYFVQGSLQAALRR